MSVVDMMLHDGHVQEAMHQQQPARVGLAPVIDVLCSRLSDMQLEEASLSALHQHCLNNNMHISRQVSQHPVIASFMGLDCIPVVELCSVDPTGFSSRPLWKSAQSNSGYV